MPSIMLTTNPFINSYLQADWFGKGVFIALILLSIASWALLFFKVWQFSRIRKSSRQLSLQIAENEDPLRFHFSSLKMQQEPFFEVYKTIKSFALPLLEEGPLSEEAAMRLEAQVNLVANAQCRALERELFFLPLTEKLGPFLGLLGTVWGILLAFSSTTRSNISNNQVVLSALSMALTTTVLGLLVAIPALIGYNYLRHLGREYRCELEEFSQRLLVSVKANSYLRHRA